MPEYGKAPLIRESGVVYTSFWRESGDLATRSISPRSLKTDNPYCRVEGSPYRTLCGSHSASLQLTQPRKFRPLWFKLDETGQYGFPSAVRV
jgi:hypothetical protein